MYSLARITDFAVATVNNANTIATRLVYDTLARSAICGGKFMDGKFIM
jgi:hypothetical protein